MVRGELWLYWGKDLARMRSWKGEDLVGKILSPLPDLDLPPPPWSLCFAHCFANDSPQAGFTILSLSCMHPCVDQHLLIRRLASVPYSDPNSAHWATVNAFVVLMLHHRQTHNSWFAAYSAFEWGVQIGRKGQFTHRSSMQVVRQDPGIRWGLVPSSLQ